MQRILIVGATSAIAQETARAFAKEGAACCLAARDEQKLAAVADDLRVRGALVHTFLLDVRDLPRHAALLETANARLGGLDAVLIAHGTLPDHARASASVEETLDAWLVNATSTIALLTLVANEFERQRRGCIAVITSVAGDRGRQSNYVYGAAKSAVSTFLQGLRNRLWRSGVRVVTIKPGLVDTPMTASRPRTLLAVPASVVGRRIHRAMRGRADVVYIPWYWRWIMAAIRAIPESVFKRLSL